MAHDFVSKVDALKADVRAFYLSPSRWRGSRVAVPLKWTSIAFTIGNRALVPKSAGVYAFVVRHVNNHFPGHGFIMYIGITGATASGRTLHARYGEYLREKREDKRAKVYYMLNKYADDIHFTYCVTDARIDLGQLELDLNDAILPPVVVKDFSAEIRKLVKAL